MGFMSGFFGSAATAYADEQARQRELALRELQTKITQQTADANAFEKLYGSYSAAWSNLSAKERLDAYNTFETVANESGLSVASGYRDLLRNQIRSMSPQDAREYLETLVTTPFDPAAPYRGVPQFAVTRALEALKEEDDYELIKADVDQYLKFTEENSGEVIALGWARARGEVDFTRARIENLDAATLRELQQYDISEDERPLLLERLILSNQLLAGEVQQRNILNGYLDARQQAELSNILLGNEQISGNIRLFEATFDSVVREMAAKANISESQARVLTATEAMDIAIRQGQVDQIPLLLEKLQLENENLDTNTRRILLDTEITEASKASLIAYNHNRAKISESQATMEATRAGQYSAELAANLRESMARVGLIEAQTVGQGTANVRAARIMDSEVRRFAADANIAESSARVSIATETARVSAANLANVLTKSNITAQDLANQYSSRTMNDRVATTAASRGITESQARVAIATEDDTIEAASLALDATRAQIALWQSSTELTAAQKNQIGRAFITEIVKSGHPELLDIFGEEILEPMFGEGWEREVESVRAAAAVSAERGTQAFTVDSALRTAQTRATEARAALDEFELYARNNEPPIGAADVIAMVTGPMGYPSLENISAQITELGFLGDSLVTARLLQEGNLDMDTATALEPLLKELNLTTSDTLYDVPPEALRFAVSALERRANTQMDAIARNLGAYAYHLYRNGHNVTPGMLGLDPDNDRHQALWAQARSTFPSTYLPEAENRRFFQNFDPAEVPGILEAATIIGTRFAPSTRAVNGVVVDPDARRFTVDAFIEEYDRVNGQGAWEALEVPYDPDKIFEAMIEPEFDAYHQLLSGIRADTIRSMNIPLDLNDSESWSGALSELNSRLLYITAAPSRGQSFYDRVKALSRNPFVFGPDNLAQNEAAQGIMRDLINNVLGGNPELVTQLGIAIPSEPGTWGLFGRNRAYEGNRWENVDYEKILEFLDEAMSGLSVSADSIYALMTRYP